MAAERFSDDLQRIVAWFCTDNLLINPDKTKLLLLGTPEMLKLACRRVLELRYSAKRYYPVVLQKIWGSSWTPP